MDQSKVNPFVGNTEASVGGSTVSAPSSPAPVNPYAPVGAPYAPGSNTPAPDYATPYASSSDNPAVPNTGAPTAYTSFSSTPSHNSSFATTPTSDRPKLFTKKFVIFAVIGIVLIAAAVVAGIIVQNNKKSGSKIETFGGVTDSTIQDNLNKLANYLSSGTESTKENANTYVFDSNGYAFKNALRDESKSYLDTTKTLLDNFVSSYEKTNDVKISDVVASGSNSSFSTLDFAVAGFYQELDFVLAFANAGQIDEEAIMSAFLASGAEGVKTLFSSKYGGLLSTSFSAGKEYVENQIAYGDAVSRRLESYGANGCVNGAYNQECIDNLPATEESENLDNEISKLLVSMDSFQNGILDETMSGCQNLHRMLSGTGSGK